MARELTSKQEAFALAVVRGLNYTDAYREAYNVARMKPETVNRNAAALAKRSKIATRIEALRAEVAADVKVEVGQVIRESARLGFADIRTIVTWDGDAVSLRPSSELTDDDAAAIKEIKVTRFITRQKDGSETERETREVKMHAKDASLDRLARLFPDFNVKHEVKHDGEVVTIVRATKSIKSPIDREEDER
jgi:phage terminase small subunit